MSVNSNPPDDLDREAIPEPDEDASPSERIRARSFADLIDKVVAGRPPAAMSADDRALAEVATAIRASTRTVELAPARRAAIVEDALRRAVADAGPGAVPTTAAATPIARRRWRQVAPWAVAAASTTVAAAAAIALWLGRPISPVPVAEAPALPLSQRSRPADALIGRIPAERSGEAAARLDAIYADRLAGFRERALAPRGRR
jgi:hypothetical protein